MSRIQLLTVGHSTASQGGFTALLAEAGVEALVDVRSAPGSKKFPWFGREQMARWVAEAGISYSHEEALGGFRKPREDSANLGWRHPSFRGYADWMADNEFTAAMDLVLAGQLDRRTALMCSEACWRRCHRRLIADYAVLVCGVPVLHLDHDGRLAEHQPVSFARVTDSQELVYDGGALFTSCVLQAYLLYFAEMITEDQSARRDSAMMLTCPGERGALVRREYRDEDLAARFWASPWGAGLGTGTATPEVTTALICWLSASTSRGGLEATWGAHGSLQQLRSCVLSSRPKD